MSVKAVRPGSERTWRVSTPFSRRQATIRRPSVVVADRAEIGDAQPSRASCTATLTALPPTSERPTGGSVAVDAIVADRGDVEGRPVGRAA